MPPHQRRPATVREVKALGHPLRQRILRLCGQHELTNKQLADRLGKDPGTVLHHVRQLVEAGLLGPAAVRTGESGALEKPYRSAGQSWWLDGGLDLADSELAPLEAFQAELSEAGPAAPRRPVRPPPPGGCARSAPTRQQRGSPVAVPMTTGDSRCHRDSSSAGGGWGGRR